MCKPCKQSMLILWVTALLKMMREQVLSKSQSFSWGRVNQGSSVRQYSEKCLLSDSTVKSASSTSVWVPRTVNHSVATDYQAIACHLSDMNLGCAVLTSCVKSLCPLGALQMLTKACQLSATWRRFKQIISKVKSTSSYFCSLTCSFLIRLCSLIIFKR